MDSWFIHSHVLLTISDIRHLKDFSKNVVDACGSGILPKQTLVQDTGGLVHP